MPWNPQARQKGAIVRRVGALVTQSSLVFNRSNTVGAICLTDAVAAVARRLQPTFQDTRAARCALPAPEARDGIDVLSGAFDMSSKASRSRRGVGWETIGSFSTASEVASAARWRMAQLLPSTQGRGGQHCVWVVAEVGRDLGHATGQGVQANVPGRGGSTVPVVCSSWLAIQWTTTSRWSAAARMAAEMS